MGIDFLVNLEDEIEVFDDSGVYTLARQQFIYEVNNLGLAETLVKILDPRYIFKPIRRFSKEKKFFVTFDRENPEIEYEERNGIECIKEIIKPLYTLNLKEPCNQEVLFDELVKTLKFLEKTYPMVIKI